MPTETNLDLKELSNAYEITGEMSGRADVRTFIARRREDRADVLIAVATTPADDEGNALSHLAADAKSLMAASHANIVRVMDARWVGTDAFAIVTPRISAPTLAELLARREEAFDYPRIATILREINGALEWARGQKIVHRAIDPEAVYVEEGSDAVLLSFTVRPLPLAEMPGAEEDARAIAALARMMLTRSSAVPERELEPLGQVRPGLPKKVVEQTEAILAGSGSSLPDISGYIASIAMAEALKSGEIEIERMAEKWAGEERAMREEIDRLRQENERIAAEQTRQGLAQRESILKDRELMERALAKEREGMERALLRDREALDEERAALAALREELVAQRELYAQTSQFQAAGAETTPAAPGPHPPRRTLWLPSRPRRRDVKRTMAWATPVAAIVTLLIVAAGLFALDRSRRSHPALGSNGVTVSTRSDSAAGAIVGVDSVPPTPAAAVPTTTEPVPMDLVSGVASRAASDSAPYRPPRPWRVYRAPPVTSAPPRVDTTVAPTFTRIVPVETLTPTDSARRLIPGTTVPIRVDSFGRPRRDSVRRDSIRRDTIPRDTLLQLPSS
jgi:hypothetical protein